MEAVVALITGLSAFSVAWLMRPRQLKETAAKVDELHLKLGNGWAERLVSQVGRVDGKLDTHMQDSAARHERTHQEAMAAKRAARDALEAGEERDVKIAELAARVSRWQSVDRVKAEGLRGALTEVGITTSEGVT